MDKSYRFLLIALDNSEGSGVLVVLHDEPRDGFLVLRIDTAGFDELGI